MKPKGRLKQALESVGAKLKRDKKHRVYELPNGKNFVIPSTPSDTRADLNAISDLRKVAGVEKPAKAPRKERRDKPGRREADWSVPVNPMAAALKDVGIVDEKFYLDRIAALENENAKLQEAYERYVKFSTELLREQVVFGDTWWVRLGRWLRVIGE